MNSYFDHLTHQYTERDWIIPLHDSLSEADIALIEAVSYVAPDTSLGKSDICVLARPNRKQCMRRDPVANMWQIRFVISGWTYGAYLAAYKLQRDGTWHDCLRAHKNDVFSMLQALNHVPPSQFRSAVIYAHAFPHGLYPDSAEWFYETHLRPYALRSSHEDWPLILDSAKALYVGHADQPLAVSLDLAPDMYRDGENLGNPFSFEESTVHTLALLGHEEFMVKPVDPLTIGM